VPHLGVGQRIIAPADRERAGRRNCYIAQFVAIGAVAAVADLGIGSLARAAGEDYIAAQRDDLHRGSHEIHAAFGRGIAHLGKGQFATASRPPLPASATAASTRPIADSQRVGRGTCLSLPVTQALADG
jgi:hypothetical protein